MTRNKKKGSVATSRSGQGGHARGQLVDAVLLLQVGKVARQDGEIDALVDVDAAPVDGGWDGGGGDGDADGRRSDVDDAVETPAQRVEGVALRQQHQQAVQRVHDRRTKIRFQQLQPEIWFRYRVQDPVQEQNSTRLFERKKLTGEDG